MKPHFTKTIWVLALLLTSIVSFSQESTYDEKLAKSLGADDYGMKKYVFCLLKTGSNTTATKEESAEAFKGHMANMGKLVKEGKLVVAGPFMKNERAYRGIFILNVATVEEAQALVDTDPAVKSKLLEAELTPWYATAGLMETIKIHDKVAKTKM